MKLNWFAVLLMVFFTAPGWAANSTPLPLRELIILGLEKNIGLQVERINIPLSAEEIRVEAAAFDSEVFTSAGYAQSSTPQALNLVSADSYDTDQFRGQIGLRKGYASGLSAAVSLSSEYVADNNQSEILEPRYRTALLLDLSQPLLRNFGAAINTTPLQLSRNQKRQASFRYFLQAQALALQVETLALQFASDVETVKLRQQARQLAQELFTANKRRFDAGVLPVSEVQESETGLAERELSLSQALQAQELSLEQLNRYLNFSLPSDFTAPAVSLENLVSVSGIDPELPDFEQLFTSAKQQRLDLKISDLEIENSSLRKKYSANQQLPQLDLKLQGGFNGLAGDASHSAAASDYAGSWGQSFSSLNAADGFQWRAGVEFSLPLGNQAAKARYRQASLRERQATYRKHDLEAALKQELLQQQTVLQRAAEQFGIAKRFEMLAEKSFQQEQRRLEEGLSDTFRIIQFQNNMINAKIDRISALTRYQLAVAKMNYSRGIILEQHGITVQAEAEEANFETL